MKYFKKPVEVEAVQWGGVNIEEIEKFVGRKLELTDDNGMLIDTKEGVMKASLYDYIIKEPFPTGDRDFYPCKQAIFEKTYDISEPDPESCDIYSELDFTFNEYYKNSDDFGKKLLDTCVDSYGKREFLHDCVYYSGILGSLIIAFELNVIFKEYNEFQVAFVQSNQNKEILYSILKNTNYYSLVDCDIIDFGLRKLEYFSEELFLKEIDKLKEIC